MADWRALTIQAGQQTQLQNADALIVGTGVKTAAGSLTINGATTVGVSPAGVSVAVFDSGTNTLVITQPIATSGNPTAFKVTGAAHTTLNPAETNSVRFDLSASVQFSTGNIVQQNAVLIQAPTYAFVGASTITTAATMSINGAPQAGTNATIANALALYLGSSLSVDDTSGNNVAFVQMQAGQSAAVSPGNTGRLIYNVSTQTFQISNNGAAYADIAMGAGSGGGWTDDGTNVRLTTATDTVTIGIAALLASEEFRVHGAQIVDVTSSTAFKVAQTGTTATFALVADTTNLRVGVGIGPIATLDVLQPNLATGVAKLIRVQGGSNTNLTASTEVLDIDFNLQHTVQHATGAIATQRAMLITAPTYSFVGSSTITTAATLAINQEPQAGANATITLSLAFDCGGPMRVTSGLNQAFIQQNAGQSSAVSPASTGRIRYNATSQHYEISENGGAYSQIGTNTTNWTLASGNLAPTTTTNSVTIGSAALTGSEFFGVKQQVTTSGSPNIILVTGAANTTLGAGAEASDVDFNLARTVQWATGAIATQRAIRVRAPTYAFVGASTITNAATFAISGAPAAGANATLTNSMALWVQAGLSRFDGNAMVGAAGTSISFFGAAVATQQTDGNNLTNNVTSGGTTAQIDDFTSLTVYATDAATIRNDIFQLARMLKIVNDALRLYGLLT